MTEQPKTPPSTGAERPQPLRPPSLRNALWLMYLAAALQAAFGIYFWILLGRLRTDPEVHAEFAASAADGADVQGLIDSTVQTWRIGVVAGTLVATALWLVMAWGNGGGRNWARVTSTVLGVFAITGSVFTLLNGFNPVALIALLVVLAVLYLLYRPETAAFFEAAPAEAPDAGTPALAEPTGTEPVAAGPDLAKPAPVVPEPVVPEPAVPEPAEPESAERPVPAEDPDPAVTPTDGPAAAPGRDAAEKGETGKSETAES
ncbi:MAG: hypothetical protein QM809_02895 [Gordonia sp. (in: high G+C Gram-positive bacteria)]|uniref:hypothetical protein n=1 Tax=Gordonia sp. (in: high G+C Gram-positive bacteria) TaxID=84139 RepID=UPI0039E5735C